MFGGIDEMALGSAIEAMGDCDYAFLTITTCCDSELPDGASVVGGGGGSGYNVTMFTDLTAIPGFCTSVVSCVEDYLGNTGVPPVVASEICAYLQGLPAGGSVLPTTQLVGNDCKTYLVSDILANLSITITNGDIILSDGTTTIDSDSLCPAVSYCLANNTYNLFTINGFQFTTGGVYTTGTAGPSIFPLISTDNGNLITYGTDGLVYIDCEAIQDCIGSAIIAGMGITYNDVMNSISTAVNNTTSCSFLNAISTQLTNTTGFRIPMMDGTNCGYIELSALFQNDLGVGANGAIEQGFPLVRLTETNLSNFDREWFDTTGGTKKIRFGKRCGVNDIAMFVENTAPGALLTDRAYYGSNGMRFYYEGGPSWITKSGPFSLYFGVGGDQCSSGGLSSRGAMTIDANNDVMVGAVQTTIPNSPYGQNAQFYVTGGSTVLTNAKTIGDEILNLNGRVPYSFLDCNNIHNLESRPKDRAGICVRPSVASTQGRIFSFDDHEDNQIVMMYSQIHPTGYLSKFNIIAPYCISHTTADTATFAVTANTYEDRSINVLYVDTTVTTKVIMPETANAKGRVFRIKIIDDTNPLEIEVQNTATQRVEERQTYNIVPNYIKPAGDGLDCMAYHLRGGTRYLI